LPEKLLRNFWKKVRKTESCWEWTASRLQSTGRGQFPNARKYGWPTSPTRFSWMLHFGVILNKLHVLHRCDNLLCVNPNHLFLGTPLDNVHDMIEKDRHSRGEKNGMATGDELLISQVRAFVGTHQQASDHFSIPRRRIIAYRRGDTWKHLKLEPINSNRRGEESFTHKFTDAQYLSVYNEKGKTIRQISVESGMSESLVGKIRLGRTSRMKRLLNEDI